MNLNEDLLNAAAASQKDHSRVLELIRQGADVRTTNSNGYTPLHLAVQKGHYDICKILLENGAGTNIVCNDEFFPLTLAISNSNDNIVRLLLQKGANPNLKTSRHGTAVDFALKKKAGVHILAVLIQHGAVVNGARHNYTPLHFACIFHHKDLVELLLHKGANTEVKHVLLGKPVDVASRRGFTDIVKVFQIDYPLWCELYLAARKGNLDECKALLEKGALTDSSQYGLYCPIAAASKKGHYETVKLLLEKRTTVNYGNNSNRNPLYLATKKGHKDIVSLLMDKGANVNMRINGDTILHLATRNTNEDLVRLLIEKGANANENSGEGYTALHYAVIIGNQTVVNCLVENGANVNSAGVRNATPLHLACEGGHQRIVQILLENGANTNLLNQQNEKPMDILNRKWLESQKLMNNMNELLMPSKANETSQYSLRDIPTEEDSIMERHLAGDSTRDNQEDSTSQYSNSDITVEYSLPIVNAIEQDLSSRLLDTENIDRLPSKMAKLSTLIFEVYEQVVNLELLEMDLTREKDTLVYLNRKIQGNRILKRLKAAEKVIYDESIQELSRKLDESRQVESQLSQEVQKLQTEVELMKTEAKKVYREMETFFK